MQQLSKSACCPSPLAAGDMWAPLATFQTLEFGCKGWEDKLSSYSSLPWAAVLRTSIAESPAKIEIKPVERGNENAK